MTQTKQLAENLRYLLWKKHGQSRECWIADVRRWFGCSSEMACELLTNGHGRSIDSAVVLETLVSQTNISDQELAHEQLLPEQEILANNIDCLFAELGHGRRAEVANEIGVDVSTISRWRRGKLKPSAERLQRLQSLFGLSDSINLRRDPLFLSIFPISESQRREWLKNQIGRLPPDDLNALFPALQRLLGGDIEDR